MDDDDDFDILLQLAEQVEAAEGEDVEAQPDPRLPLLLQRQAQDDDMRLERAYGREALRQALGPGPCSSRDAGGECIIIIRMCMVHCMSMQWLWALHLAAAGTCMQPCACREKQGGSLHHLLLLHDLPFAEQGQGPPTPTAWPLGALQQQAGAATAAAAAAALV